jgi:hypothetical protein
LDFHSESFFFCCFAGSKPGGHLLPDVRRTTEVLPFVALVFIDPFDYMTLRSALIVSIDNVHAGTSFLFSVFKGMNTVATLLLYNYVE